jgi:glycerophosphoryl diester phosphodiesterase
MIPAWTKLAVAVPVSVVSVAADCPAGASLFDIEAHRGGLGLRPGSSPAAFAHALGLGVTTLELEVQITEDGRADPGLLQIGQPGASPWLGGIDIDDFGGDPVRAATSFDADAISPVHGDPQTGSVLDAGYRPYTTVEMVDAAHAAGMRVIPWTVDDAATMSRLIDMQVDGIITDYPDRLRDVHEVRGAALPRSFTAPG